MKKAYLILEDGTAFEGVGFGASGGGIGELVYTTGVCGYIETLTDPTFYGQIILQTFPSIGNYGMIDEDIHGPCYAKGYVVREWCDTPSNFRSQYDIDTYLKQQRIPGICGVDTRAIASILREKGPMNAMITDAVPADLTEIQNYRIQNAVAAVTARERVTYPAVGTEQYKVAVLDLGVKHSIIEQLQKRGCTVTVLPATATAQEISDQKNDGLVIAGGPGDPNENTTILSAIAALMGKLPVFGIGLGHQLMALAKGGQVAKMKQGHRGGNQPAREVGTLRTYITAQNHGYVVLSDTVADGSLSFYNINDKTCEGIEYKGLKAFSVQFDPEEHTGNRNPAVLYDRFVDMMGGK